MLAVDELNLAENVLKFKREENIARKGENAVYHFLHFLQCFQKSSTWGS